MMIFKPCIPSCTQGSVAYNMLDRMILRLLKVVLTILTLGSKVMGNFVQKEILEGCYWAFV